MYIVIGCVTTSQVLVTRRVNILVPRRTWIFYKWTTPVRKTRPIQPVRVTYRASSTIAKRQFVQVRWTLPALTQTHTALHSCNYSIDYIFLFILSTTFHCISCCPYSCHYKAWYPERSTSNVESQTWR